MRRRREEPLDPLAIAADDAALDVLVDDAVSWDSADPAFEVLAALYEDVSAELPEPSTSLTPTAAVDLNRARRRRHAGKRTVVAAGVTAAVLSVSGVAAAAIATSPNGPLGPIHRFFVGSQPTPSEHAAKQVRLFLGAAKADLAANRLTAAGEALDHATTWLSLVDATDRADLPAQLAALRAQYVAASASATPPVTRANDGSGHGDKVGTRSGSHDPTHKGSDTTGDRGDRAKAGSHDGSGSGEHQSGSGGGDTGDKSGSGSGSSGSGSGDSGSRDSGSGGDSSSGGTVSGSGSDSSDSVNSGHGSTDFGSTGTGGSNDGGTGDHHSGSDH